MNKSTRRLAAGILFVLFFQGCAVNQEREVATYREVLDAGQPTLAEPFQPADSLSLAQALTLANAGSETLAIIGENYLQALIDKDRAFARFLPTIGLAPAYMRQEKTSLGAENSLISEFVRDETLDVPVQGGLDISPVTDTANLNAADLEAARQRALLLDQRAVVLLDVAQTYYQVLSAEAESDVLAHSVEVQTRRVSDIRVQRDAGVARSLDVAQAEAQLAETRAALIRAENDAANGRAMLALLLGVSSVEGPLTDGFAVPAADFSMDAITLQATDRRQDLKASKALLEVSAKRLQSAWGEYFPSVSLNLSQYLSRESFPSDVDWTALLTVRVPLFSAGLTHADVRSAYSRLRQAGLADSLVRRQILKDLRSAREDLMDVDRRIEQIEIQVTASREAMRLAEAAYRSGLATNLSRITVQDQLLRAELAETRARFERNVAYLRLLRATGGLDATLSLLPVSSVENTPADGDVAGSIN